MLERVAHPIALMRRRVACDSRVSVAPDCESARADGTGIFKRRRQVVGANRLARNVQKLHRSEAEVSGTFDSIRIKIIAD